jgi:hypothetical protein
MPFLGIYPKERKSIYKRDVCTFMFIAALFIITKIWNHHRCPTTSDLIKKMWYIHTMDYYSTIKKNEIMSPAGKCMELEIIMFK